MWGVRVRLSTKNFQSSDAKNVKVNCLKVIIVSVAHQAVISSGMHNRRENMTEKLLGHASAKVPTHTNLNTKWCVVNKLMVALAVRPYCSRVASWMSGKISSHPNAVNLRLRMMVHMIPQFYRSSDGVSCHLPKKRRRREEKTTETRPDIDTLFIQIEIYLVWVRVCTYVRTPVFCPF